MAVKYNKLFKLLIDRDIKKGELQEMAGISSSIMSRLGRNLTVRTDTIERICIALDCQPNDIMEIIPDSVKKKGTLEKLSEYYKAGVNYTMSKTDEEIKQAKSKPIKALKETAKEGIPIVAEINRKQKAEDRYIDSLKDE